MKIYPYWIIYGLILYLPFEDFILKWLPVSDNIYSLARLASEAILYLLLIAVLSYRMIHGKNLKRTPIDIPLLVFIFIAIISIFSNGASLLGGLVGIRLLLRYITVYYIIVNIGISRKQSMMLLKVIVIIGIVESFLGLVEYFCGERVINFFAPREVDLEFANLQLSLFSNTPKIGSVFGTFGKPAAMAYFLLIPIILLGSSCYLRTRRLLLNKTLFWVIILMLGLFVTYKRGALLISLLIIPIIIFLYSERHQLTKLKVLIIFVTSVIICLTMLLASSKWSNKTIHEKTSYVNPAHSLTQLISESYWENTMSVSRGWFIREVGVSAISSGKLLGYSPDETSAKETLAKKGGSFGKLASYNAFDDVYWVAMLIYYGIIGFSIYMWILFRLYRISKQVSSSLDDFSKQIGVIFRVLVIITIPATFLERSFELRAFGFCFWLLAGLVVLEYFRLRQNKNFFMAKFSVENIDTFVVKG